MPPSAEHHAAADEGSRGEPVERRQLPDAVEQNDCRPSLHGELGALPIVDSALPQQGLGFPKGGYARSEKQQGASSSPELFEGIEDRGLLLGMRRAGNEDRPVPGKPSQRHLEVAPRLESQRIELQVTGDPDASYGNAVLDQLPSIFLEPYSKQLDRPEQGQEKLDLLLIVEHADDGGGKVGPYRREHDQRVELRLDDDQPSGVEVLDESAHGEAEGRRECG